MGLLDQVIFLSLYQHRPSLGQVYRAAARTLVGRLWATNYALASQGRGRGRKLVGPLTDEINRSAEAL